MDTKGFISTSLTKRYALIPSKFYQYWQGHVRAERVADDLSGDKIIEH